ncbi:MAG: type I polyketide synthase [Planctomycetota bacterium]
MTPTPEERPDGAEPIAVIGLGCRFPGAPSPTAFWDLLREGRDAVREVPPDRWNADAFYDPDPNAPGRTISRWGGFLDDVEGFDAAFFGISAREAAGIDPQQRLLLEVAWEALEDAGQVPKDLAGSSAGVFVGISTNDYSFVQPRDPERIDAYWSTGSSLCIAANRLSYALDLRGPNVSIDTACSASLVALHYACLSLRAGECELAIAGGANLILSPAPAISFAKAGALAVDGRCKPFDASADGIVRGEGAGLVVLKPLSLALRDGDPIQAVVRGSAVNQDGATNGLTAPSRRAQEEVLRRACADGAVAPEDVQYVEAHGTGTLLGDPIELKALSAVFAKDRARMGPLAIGSVKSNLGHLESAAGVASLIKVVLALRERRLPPSLHFREPNPYASLEQLGLRVPTETEPWPEGDTPRAGVSCFGFGGTNAHMVLEAPPEPKRGPASGAHREGRGAFLLPISARSEASLRRLAGAWGSMLDGADPAPIAELCAAAALQRSHLDHRACFAFTSPAELRDGVQAYLAGRKSAGVSHGHHVVGGLPRRLVFVFAGQGSGWSGEAAELLREPVFREALARCDEALGPLGVPAVIERLERGRRPDDLVSLQPALFAVQVALAELWRSWGLVPEAIVGHSLGEVAAAHVAGALMLDDAARVVVARSELMAREARSTDAPGGMAGVRGSREDVEALLAEAGDSLVIAVHNGPRSVVVAGLRDELDQLLRLLRKRRIAGRILPVPGAGHQEERTDLEAELAERLAEIRPEPPALPLYSTVVAERVSDAPGPAYWARNLTQPVRFFEAVTALVRDGFELFLELSTHPVLSPAVGDTLRHLDRRGAAVPSLRSDCGAHRALFESLARLYAEGRDVRWERLNGPSPAHAPLPLYPWNRSPHWFEDRRATVRRVGTPDGGARGASSGGSLLGPGLRPAYDPGLALWQADVSDAPSSWLLSRRIEGLGALPPGGVVQLLSEAAGADALHLRELRVDHTAFFGADGSLPVQLVVRGDAGEREARLYRLRGAPGESSQVAELLAEGRLAEPESPATADDPRARREALPEHADGREVYRLLHEAGVHVAPEARLLAEVWWSEDEVLACLAAQDPGAVPTRSARLFEAVSDLLAAHAGLAGGAVAVPLHWSDVAVAAVGEGRIWIHAERASDDRAVYRGLRLVDEQGAAVGSIATVRCADHSRFLRDAQPFDGLYRTRWRAAEPEPGADAPEPVGRWLVIADEAGTGAALAAELERRGAACRCVSLRERELDPRRRGGWARLLDEIEVPGDGALGVAYLPALDLDASWSQEPCELAAGQAAALGGALNLANELAARRAPEGGATRLWLVTRGAHAVAAEEACVAFPQATLWGLGRTIAQERPEVFGGMLDLDPAEHDGAQAPRAAELLVGGTDGEDQLALRGGQRHVLRLVRAPRAEVEAELSIEPAGTYLISGGLGELGLALARWLVERGARDLLLLGRTPLPPLDAWERLAEDDPARPKVECIRALEALGARVDTAAVDVAAESELRTLLGRWRTAGRPPVRGCFHLAGSVEPAAVADLTQTDLERALRAKVVGTHALHRALADEEPELFVLFSSGASILGSPLLAGYAAANAFLDAYAEQLRAAGRTALSVRFGFWEESGMAARMLRENRGAQQPHGMLGFSDRQGFELLEHVLAHDLDGVAPVHYDWREWAAHHPRAAAGPFLREIFAAPAEGTERDDPAVRSLSRAELLALPAKERGGALEAHLSHLVARTVGTDGRIHPDQPLTDLGIDSLMALELRNRVEVELEVAVPMVSFLERPSLRQLGASLLVKIESGPVNGSNGTNGHVAETPDLERPDRLLDRVDDLSEEEVERLLVELEESADASLREEEA